MAGSVTRRGVPVAIDADRLNPAGRSASSLIIDQEVEHLLRDTRWQTLARSRAERLQLFQTISGIPECLIDQVEANVIAVAGRGVVIRDPLGYRLACLRNGLMGLQECKYICDQAELALRQALFRLAARTPDVRPDNLLKVIGKKAPNFGLLKNFIYEHWDATLRLCRKSPGAKGSAIAGVARHVREYKTHFCCAKQSGRCCAPTTKP